MSDPAPRTSRAFEDRPAALAGFVDAAGVAPSLLPAAEHAGLPLFHALAALQWTGETGLVRSTDRLHAVWFAGEAAAVVIERVDSGSAVFRYIGPRLETRQRTPEEGKKVVDEPFVRGYEFAERWSALGHFFAVTQGEGSLVALMSARAPLVEHVRRWLLELFQGPLPTGADHLHAAWFATTGAGFLFPPDATVVERRGYTYVEVGTRTD
ncbi:MAG: hypothetical protein A2085_02750 [Gemmatimonadetes bacterium GWC2_71_10]|nr:MAG: hypothetical protein A2085_02750 [Gemmatimonadetes bacterium GWC2_71_10]